MKKFRFTKNKFDLEQTTSIGIDNEFLCVQLTDGSIIKLRIMDTAGQERFDSINEKFYKEADCCLLVYDITKKKSFKRIKNYYIKKIKENCKNIFKVVLLGNKTDKNDEREVSEKDGRDLALKNNYIFMESSCKDNYNVSDAFTALVEMTNIDMKKNNLNVNNDSIIKIRAGDKINDKKKKKCCLF